MASPSALDALAAGAADRRVGIVVNLAAGNRGNFGIQQRGQAAQDARLGLPAQSQQDEVVPRKQRIDDLRDHRFFVAVNAGEQRIALFQARQKIFAQFLLHAALRDLFLRPSAAPKLAKSS